MIAARKEVWGETEKLWCSAREGEARRGKGNDKAVVRDLNGMFL